MLFLVKKQNIIFTLVTLKLCLDMKTFLTILAFAAVNAAETDCIANFVKWVNQYNGKISDKVAIERDLLTGIGIYAKSTIYEIEEIASIPVSLLISSGYAMDLLQQRIFNRKMSRKEIKVKVCQKSKDIVLALGFLIEYKNELNSKWKPYFQCLPSPNNDYIDNLIISWSEIKLKKEFQASKLVEFVQQRKDFIQSSYDNFVDNFKEIYDYLDELTLNEWKWALSIVWSRSFSVTINGQKTKCLVPFGDFFNFNNIINTKSNDKLMLYDVQSMVKTINDKEYLIFKASNVIKEGRQIYAEYSLDVVNDLYASLLDYGFCMKLKDEQNELVLNPMDGIWITVQDMIQADNGQIYGEFMFGLDAEYKQKVGMMIQSMDYQQLYVRCNGKDQYSLFLLSFILISSKDGLDLYGDDLMDRLKIIKDEEMNADVYNKVIDVDGEIFDERLMVLAYQKLMEFLEFVMRKYETTIIQDLMHLDKADGINCPLNIRLSEKFTLLELHISIHSKL